MRQLLRTGTVVMVMMLALASMMVPALAKHCDSGRFCAFDLTNYQHPRLVNSGAPPGTDTVQVDNNRVASAKNRTGNRWCGVESEGWPDDTIWSFPPHTWYDTLGSRNNDIDHFYVRRSDQQCD